MDIMITSLWQFKYQNSVYNEGIYEFIQTTNKFHFYLFRGWEYCWASNLRIYFLVAVQELFQYTKVLNLREK